MSGLKAKSKKNRLRRKNVSVLEPNDNVESDIRKPLTIVRIKKQPTILKPDSIIPQVSMTVHKDNNILNSDYTTLYATPTTSDTIGSDTKLLSFESSDLSSEEGDIFEPSTSPMSVNTENNMSYSQGVELSRLPKVKFIDIKQQPAEQLKSDASDEESVYQQQQQLQEEQLLIQHYQMLQHQHPHSINPINGQSNKDIINSSRIFNRPENHYIHHIEPSDGDLYDSIEYDMDEQDKHWLMLYNKERRQEFLQDASPYLFECIMDKLEKEWFNLVKSAPQPENEDEPAFPEDSACAVCGDNEVENSNAIVFCDGCNLAVHQDCYGVPYIPEGLWLCRKCMISPEFPVSCIFCPNEGGAFKQTNTNRWAHLLCAIWIPEVGVSNAIYMEPIESIESIPKSRWKLTCYICRKKQGACIQCDNKLCYSSFHVTCAKQAGLCMKINSNQSQDVVLQAYCEKHSPKDYEHPSEHLSDTSDKSINSQGTRGRGRKRGHGRSKEPVNGIGQQQQEFNAADSKVARAHQHLYSGGVPIVSDYILNKIDNLPCVQFSGIRKCQQLVNDIAHYWSLKRESKRGAPLLKRLHFEPWTATAKYNGDKDDLTIRKSIVSQLRADLEKVRILSEQVQRRERYKLERLRNQKAYLEMILFPLEYVVQPILDEFIEIDRKKLFASNMNQVQEIENPMCFSTIQQKLSHHQYQTLDQFEADIELIWENCINYNPKNKSYCKVANRLKKASKKLFAIARKKMARFERSEDGAWKESIDLSIFEQDDDVQETVMSPNLQDILMEPKIEQSINSPVQIQESAHGDIRLSLPQLESNQHMDIPINESFDVDKGSSSLIEMQQFEPENLDIHSLIPLDLQSVHCYEEFNRQHFNEEVASLAIQKPMLHDSMSSYPAVFCDASMAMDTDNSLGLTIDHYDNFFQQNGGHMNLLDMPIPNSETIQEKTTATVFITPNDLSKNTDKGKKRQRNKSSEIGRRLTRSAGLQASIEEITKRRKISKEARRLYSSYNGVSHLDKQTEAFKENKKKHAPIGWVYVDEGSDSSSEDEEEEEEEGNGSKRKHGKQTRNGIPVPDFRRGEIVWARVDKYPSHPAKFLNYSDEEAGPKLVASRRYAGDVLVEFLKVPEMHRYGWVGRRTICELGDSEIDTKRLSEAFKKKSKRSQFIEEAKEGYRCAGSILGLDPEPIIRRVFETPTQHKKKKHSNKHNIL